MRTLNYGNDIRQTLDLYDSASSDLLIIGLHGGSWIQGDKSSLMPYAKIFTDANITFASINYRLLPTHTLEDMIADLNSAIYFLSKTIKFKKVGLFGISAGAHVALISTYLKRLDAKIECVLSEVGPTDFTDRSFISNMIFSTAQFGLLSQLTKSKFTLKDYYNGKNDPAWVKYSPVAHVSKDTPSTLLTYAKKDQLVPYQNGLTLYKLLNQHQVKTELISFEYSSHFLESPLDHEVRSYYHQRLVEFAHDAFK